MTAYTAKQMTNRICYLFIIFLIGSFVGWVYEEIFYWIAEGLLRNRGVLYGPWLPIYGIGAIGLYVLKPINKYPAVLFILSAVVSGIVEGLIGLIGIYGFNMRLWDYRGKFLNIGGIVCLRSIITFAIGGLFLHYLIDPALKHVVNKMDRNAVWKLCFIPACLLLADIIVSILFRTPITY